MNKVVIVKKIHGSPEVIRGALIQADLASVCVRIVHDHEDGWRAGDYTVPWSNVDYVFEEPGQ